MNPGVVYYVPAVALDACIMDPELIKYPNSLPSASSTVTELNMTVNGF